MEEIWRFPGEGLLGKTGSSWRGCAVLTREVGQQRDSGKRMTGGRWRGYSGGGGGAGQQRRRSKGGGGGGWNSSGGISVAGARSGGGTEACGSGDKSINSSYNHLGVAFI